MQTHIQTLSDNTRKARQRVRKAMGLENTVAVTSEHVANAVAKATEKERKHAPKKAKK